MKSHGSRVEASDGTRIPNSVIVTLIAIGMALFFYGLSDTSRFSLIRDSINSFMNRNYIQICRDHKFLCENYDYLWASPLQSWTLRDGVHVVAAYLFRAVFGIVAGVAECLNAFTTLGISVFVTAALLESYNSKYLRKRS